MWVVEPKSIHRTGPLEAICRCSGPASCRWGSCQSLRKQGAFWYIYAWQLLISPCRPNHGGTMRDSLVAGLFAWKYTCLRKQDYNSWLETDRVDHLRKIMVESVCVVILFFLNWASSCFHGYMDCITKNGSPNYMQGNNVLHRVSFWAMQMQYAQWYHQKPHRWAHLWTFFIQNISITYIVWCWKLEYTDVFCHYKSCLRAYYALHIKRSVANAWWHAYFPSMIF